MNEQLTLKELMALMPAVIEDRERGKAWLEDGYRAIASYESPDIRITVFGCGYALAQQGSHWTVFPVSDCGGYEYEVDEADVFEDMPQTKFDTDYFMEKPWTLRLTMVALERLESNNDEAFEGLISKHPGYVENFDWLFGVTPSAEHEVIQKMWWEEILSCLSVKQREVIELREAGYTEAEVGGILEISRNAVSTHIQRSRAKLAKGNLITEY